MRTDLALKNLWQSKGRTAAAAAGVAFAVVLIFMQVGFYRALERSATVIFDALAFDLCLRSPDYLRLADPGSFPRRRLHQALSISQVRTAQPLWVGLRMWRTPVSGEKRPLLVLGVERTGQTFRSQALQQQVHDNLTLPHCILIDRLTRAEFGPVDGKAFGDADVGLASRYEISQQPVQIVGHYALGAGFTANGSIVVNAEGFRRLTPGMQPDRVQLGLLTIEPGADPQRVQTNLSRILPHDVHVLTRQEVLQMERDFWVRQSSYGLVFQVGIAIALLVGAAVVYQILSSDVAALMPEYATLIAIGYSYRQLVAVVIRQGLWLALLGYIPGLLLSQVLYYVTRHGARVPMDMSWYDGLVVLGLATAMCSVSAVGAAMRLLSADPASLY